MRTTAQEKFYGTLEAAIKRSQTVRAEKLAKMATSDNGFLYELRWSDGVSAIVYTGQYARETMEALPNLLTKGTYREALTSILTYYTEQLYRWGLTHSSSTFANAVQNEQLAALQAMREMVQGAVYNLDWEEEAPAREAAALARMAADATAAAEKAAAAKVVKAAARKAKVAQA